MAEFKPAVEFFRSKSERIKGRIGVLGASLIPATVTHNDLSFSNVYKPADSENFMFFDWVDSYVGHPFTTYLSEMDKNAYLKMWLEYGTFEELTQTFSIGQTAREIIECFPLCIEAAAMESPESDDSFQALGDKLMSITCTLRKRWKG